MQDDISAKDIYRPKAFQTWNQYLEWLDSFLAHLEKVDMEEKKSSEYRTLKMMISDERHFPNRGLNHVETLI